MAVSMNFKITSCTTEERHDQTMVDDEFDIEIVIIMNRSKQTSTFTLPLGDPQLVTSENILEVIWDAVSEELDELDIDQPFHSKIIEAIASACLCTSISNNNPSCPPRIVLRVEEENPREVIKNMLVNNGVIIMSSKTSAGYVEAWLPSNDCAICLEKAVPCARDGAGYVEVARLRCSHVYHLDCVIDLVLCSTARSATVSCPLCRVLLFDTTTNGSSSLITKA